MHSRLLLSAIIASSLAAGAAGIAQPPPDHRSPETVAKTARVFVAIRDGDDAGLAAALKAGADPNGRNWLGFTPLQWASGRGLRSQVDYLLSHGARINDPSQYGAALTMALNGRHDALAMYLLAKGENPNSVRLDGATPMMLAAADGFLDVIQVLAKRGAGVNAQDGEQNTALMYAARKGQTKAMSALIALGANVSMADRHGHTALMEAASNGNADAVGVLLKAHAAIGAKDSAGNTALMLAGRYCTNPSVIDQLLKHGADPRLRDPHGNTPLSLAIGRGHNETAARLRQAAIGLPVGSTDHYDRSQAAEVQASLTAIEGSMKHFTERTGCASCHHHGLGLITLGIAAQSGFKVDGKLIGDCMGQLAADGQAGAAAMHTAALHPEMAGIVQAVDIGDFTIGAGYMLGALAANHVPGNPGLEEAAKVLCDLQQKDGSWVYGFAREPMQSSPVTTTALVVQVVREYGSKDSGGVAESIGRAKEWLLKQKPEDTESKAFKLLGLKWAGATDEELAAATKDVLSAQHGDGGWSQTTLLAPNAYETGVALYALNVGGSVPADNRDIAQGVRYLLRTQDEDGTWYVAKRAMPANNYFDTGFPHGESQYASFAATCWAAIALAKTMPAHQTAAR